MRQDSNLHAFRLPLSRRMHSTGFCHSSVWRMVQESNLRERALRISSAVPYLWANHAYQTVSPGRIRTSTRVLRCNLLDAVCVTGMIRGITLL